jgi:hypothetical protein
MPGILAGGAWRSFSRCPLGLAGGYVRRRVGETSQFLAVKQAGQVIRQPIPRLLANDRTALIRGFALIAAGSVAFDTFFIFMPNHLAALGAGPKLRSSRRSSAGHHHSPW